MTLQVHRNNRNTLSGLKTVLHNLYFNPDLVSLYGAHVFFDNVEDVMSHFLFNHQLSGHSLHILFHCITIDYDELESLSMVQELTEIILSLFSAQFQVVAGIIRSTYSYQAVFVINGVSRDGRDVFHDCNRIYLELRNELMLITGNWLGIEFANNVIFKNINNNRENYISC